MSRNLSHEPPIKLEGFTLLNLAIDTVDRFDCDAETSESRLEIGFVPELHPEDAHRFRVTVSVTMGPDTKSSNVPYSLSARSTAYFVASQEIERDAVDPALFVNALTIMYGVLRGIVLQCTAAAGNGPAILPTVMMVDVVASQIASDQTIAADSAETRVPKRKANKSAVARKQRKRSNE
jgi:preprotein translocase subunit SecB